MHDLKMIKSMLIGFGHKGSRVEFAAKCHHGFITEIPEFPILLEMRLRLDRVGLPL